MKFDTPIHLPNEWNGKNPSWLHSNLLFSSWLIRVTPGQLKLHLQCMLDIPHFPCSLFSCLRKVHCSGLKLCLPFWVKILCTGLVDFSLFLQVISWFTPWSLADNYHLPFSAIHLKSWGEAGGPKEIFKNNNTLTWVWLGSQHQWRRRYCLRLLWSWATLSHSIIQGEDHPTEREPQRR